MTARRFRCHSSQRAVVTSQDPAATTPCGRGSPTGTPICCRSARLAAPRRASSTATSGVPRSPRSAAARARAAPRRWSGGGSGSRMVAPPTTWRRPGSRSSTRSPTCSGSEASRMSRTTQESDEGDDASHDVPGDPPVSSRRILAGTAAAPTWRTPCAGQSLPSTRASTTAVRNHAPGVEQRVAASDIAGGDGAEVDGNPGRGDDDFGRLSQALQSPDRHGRVAELQDVAPAERSCRKRPGDHSAAAPDRERAVHPETDSRFRIRRREPAHQVVERDAKPVQPGASLTRHADRGYAGEGGACEALLCLCDRR